MSLPKRYALSVEVKLVELPNQFAEPEEPFQFSTDDPMKQAAELMGRATRVMTPVYPAYPQQPAGFDWRKSANVSVSNFGALAKIISQYDELTQQIESERP